IDPRRQHRGDERRAVLHAAGEARLVTRRKTLFFALMAVLLATTVTAAGLLAVDIYLHGRYERSAGYNVWGYRGPRVGVKRPGEYRIAVLGGSTAFGYGVSWDEAIPAQLEGMLAASTPGVTVVNLAYNNEGAYSLRFTLEDYLWLHYDLAILYDGYNDVALTPPDVNRQVFRRDSPVFRWTGYLPIFPVVFKEKAASMISGGDAGAAYASGKTVFRPTLTTRGAAGALTAAASIGEALETQINKVSSPAHQRAVDRDDTGCEFPWTVYCASAAAAIEFARAHDVDVLFVGQPEFPEHTARRARHEPHQHEVAPMIARRFGHDPHVQYTSMTGVVDLRDPATSFDEMHLTADGNRRVAARLADAVRPFIARHSS
ncbi:MAG: SGNH/GDSL hydrolase family protein, partial [Acidimicrobiia bacterium]